MLLTYIRRVEYAFVCYVPSTVSDIQIDIGSSTNFIIELGTRSYTWPQGSECAPQYHQRLFSQQWPVYCNPLMSPNHQTLIKYTAAQISKQLHINSSSSLVQVLGALPGRSWAVSSWRTAAIGNCYRTHVDDEDDPDFESSACPRPQCCGQLNRSSSEVRCYRSQT